MSTEKLWYRICGLVTVVVFCAQATVVASQDQPKAPARAHVEVASQDIFSKKSPTHGEGTYVGKSVAGVLRDVVFLQGKLFAWDSFKVFVGTMPFWIGGRMIDDSVQHCFYDRSHHKNIHQLHSGFYHFAKNSLAIPIVVLGSAVFWTKDEEFHETSRCFLIGLPFVIWSKHLIKKLHADACKRPWNEYFSRKHQSYGGFPSGHMAEIVYSTVLFGKRLGPKAGVPLGIISAVLGVTFVNCNRHYVSQIVAGAGLGTLYALAADKLISQNLERKHPVEVDVALNERGGPEVRVGVSF